jgi:valyl-tRNA synthetase
VDIAFATGNEDARALIAANDAILLSLTRGEKISLSSETAGAAGEQIFWNEAPIVVSISRELSPEERQKEIEKIKRDLLKITSDAEKLAQRLENPNFVEKAPPAVVEKGRADLAELHHRKASLEERLTTLNS